MDARTELLAYKYGIKNAFLHEGKAEAGAIIGKIIALEKDADLKKLMPKIQEAVARINSMPLAEIESEYRRFEAEGYGLKPKPEREGLPKIGWAEKKEKEMITRYAPNPNGPFHLGNARAAVLSYEYARMYEGKFILRFDDTDPKVKKSIENSEAIFREDLEWLGCKVGPVYYASDRIPLYCEYMRKAIEMGKAYVCTCKPEDWRKKTLAKKECDCRDLDEEEQLERFEKMVEHGYREGEAVLRIKTDLNSEDPSIRDWWAAKIVDSPNHPRVGEKYHVWPSYNFASAIDDKLLGTTLILRGQEHAQNAEKQKWLYRYFGWDYPEAIHFGRIKLGEMVLSTSAIKKGIEEKKFLGWDDPRLGTIRAFRRRGFSPKALYATIVELGTKHNDATVSMQALADKNRGEIDRKSDRFLFVEEPVRLDIQFCPETNAKIRRHPDFPERGEREYVFRRGSMQVLGPKKALAGIAANEIFRLVHAFGARMVKQDMFQAFAEFAGIQRSEKNPAIPWIFGETADCDVMMPDAAIARGVCEKELLEKKPDDTVQLECFGYCRVDKVAGNRVALWYCHE
ncbi:MAG: glutamate--tRNA ligase [archaeon]